MEFSIKDIIILFMKRIVLIIVCTLTGLSTFFIINQFIINPSYTASVQFYVNTNDATAAADLNDLYYAQKVVNTYINFLKTKVFYNQVIEASDMHYKPGQLKEMTEINSVNNTEIFQINVTSHSANDSYNLVLAMQKIAPELIKSIKSSAEISVVDPVAYPTEPSGPNILINTTIGGIIGFLIAILTTFLWEIIDVKVKNQDELIKKYNIPILGLIPSYNKGKKYSYLLRKILYRKYKNQSEANHVINEDTKFIITEAYKALRTNLRYTICKSECKKILINSPIPEDGKSTTCTNIGITIAQTNAKVLLIDCDLRRGKLHNLFNLKNSPGISDILSGMSTEKEVIQNTIYENLQVITMGSIPPNPTELLASSQMEELLKSLEENYDYIIIDSPPVNVVSDALSLAKLVDGIILVVRQNNTSHPHIASAITKYDFVEAKILGIVLNEISLNQGNKSKSSYYYYSKND